MYCDVCAIHLPKYDMSAAWWCVWQARDVCSAWLWYIRCDYSRCDCDVSYMWCECDVWVVYCCTYNGMKLWCACYTCPQIWYDCCVWWRVWCARDVCLCDCDIFGVTMVCVTVMYRICGENVICGIWLWYRTPHKINNAPKCFTVRLFSFSTVDRQCSGLVVQIHIWRYQSILKCLCTLSLSIIFKWN